MAEQHAPLGHAGLGAEHRRCTTDSDSFPLDEIFCDFVERDWRTIA